ncbi:MAG: hypothetical protein ACJ796_14140 [Gemmatimonadaceae bacterium]
MRQGPRVRRTKCGVGQLDHTAVVEHQPCVAVATPRVAEPLERHVVVGRVVVVQHHAAARRGERFLNDVGVDAPVHVHAGDDE